MLGQFHADSRLGSAAAEDGLAGCWQLLKLLLSEATVVDLAIAVSPELTTGWRELAMCRIVPEMREIYGEIAVGVTESVNWENPEGSSGGPIGDAEAKALDQGYSIGKSGFHGYYFRILKGQGPAATMGRGYVIEGIMIGRFALLAVPAEYRVMGIKTFIVGNDGIVYQKDLGPKSLEIAKQMGLYNPDKTWQRTDDEWPGSVTDVARAGATP